ncbi:MAG: hypothetical protein ACRCYO_00440, partial [Bacteroidia bacterium]
MESDYEQHLYEKSLKLMKPVVQIPEPCSEDWNKMTPETQGRFCDKCCKVVVDFTEKTTTEI